MAFPRPLPATGTHHREDDIDWAADGDKWRKSVKSESWTFLAAGDSQPSWNWLGLTDIAESFITIKAALNVKQTGDIGFIVNDGSGSMDLTSSTVSGYVLQMWAGDGQNFKDWNTVVNPNPGIGIGMNRDDNTYHVKQDNWGFVEIQLLAFGTGVFCHWQFQYQSDDDSEMLVFGNVYIDKPLTSFRKVGFRCQHDIDTQAIHLVYV
jgi:hypothetical protein